MSRHAWIPAPKNRRRDTPSHLAKQSIWVHKKVARAAKRRDIRAVDDRPGSPKYVPIEEPTVTESENAGLGIWDCRAAPCSSQRSELTPYASNNFVPVLPPALSPCR